VRGVYWVTSLVRRKWGLVVAEPCDRKESRALGLTLILSALALCCNPVGVRLLLYPLNLWFQQTTNLSSIEEWFPLDVSSARGIAIVGTVLAIFLLSLLRRTELRLRDLLMVLVVFALALQHTRMMFLFGIVAGPVLCRLLVAELGSDRQRDHPWANGVLISICLAVAAVAFPSAREIQRQTRKSNPVGAVDYIRRTGLAGPMLNDYGFGGYLIWALPENKVFIDGRADIFDWAGVMSEFGRWATLQDDPVQLLDKYRIRFCLLSKNAPMGRLLPYLPGWRKAYSDDVATVFVR